MNDTVQRFIAQSVVLITCLVMAVAGLLIYNFQLIGLPDIWRFILSSTLVLGGLFILVENLAYRITNKLDVDRVSMEREVQDLRVGIDSTVKTLTFFGHRDGASKRISNVRMSSEPIRIIDDVIQGDIDMRILSHFLQKDSTALIVEGKKGSMFRRHTQPQFVHLYVVEGCLSVEVDGLEPVRLNKGETVKVDSDVYKEILFEENATLLFTFTPALEDWVEGQMEVGKLS